MDRRLLAAGWFDSRSELLHWLTSGAAALSLLAVALLVVRRTNGALHEPLDEAPLLAATASFVGIGVWLRLVLNARRPKPGRRQRIATQVAIGCAIVLAVAAIGLPAKNATSLVAAWLLVAVGEAAAWRPWRRWSRAPTSNAQVLQRLVYSHSAEGGVAVRGWQRVSLAAGQRTHHCHVAFCPPLAGVPQVAMRQTSGRDCRLKLGQALPFGLRFDLKLVSEHPDAACVEFEFTATDGAAS